MCLKRANEIKIYVVLIYSLSLFKIKTLFFSNECFFFVSVFLSENYANKNFEIKIRLCVMCRYIFRSRYVKMFILKVMFN